MKLQKLNVILKLAATIIIVAVLVIASISNANAGDIGDAGKNAQQTYHNLNSYTTAFRQEYFIPNDRNVMYSTVVAHRGEIN